MKCRSEWQRPATLVRIKTSRGPGLLTLTSSITSGLLTSYRTAAFIGVFPIQSLSLSFFDADFDTKAPCKSSCPGMRKCEKWLAFAPVLRAARGSLRECDATDKLTPAGPLRGVSRADRLEQAPAESDQLCRFQKMRAPCTVCAVWMRARSRKVTTPSDCAAVFRFWTRIWPSTSLAVSLAVQLTRTRAVDDAVHTGCSAVY